MQKCLENGRGTIYSPSVLISWETVTFKMFNYPWGSLHMWFMLYIYHESKNTVRYDWIVTFINICNTSCMSHKALFCKDLQ